MNNLQKNIVAKIKRVSKFLTNTTLKIEKDRFLEKFMFCEVACKEVLAAYFCEKQNVNRKDIKLNMKFIPAAMRKAEYRFDKNLLSSIFGGSIKRGNKSAKKLRDGIAHSLSIEDMNEVFTRREILHQAMDEFLLAISPVTDEESQQ